jgi:hypothetical protein
LQAAFAGDASRRARDGRATQPKRIAQRAPARRGRSLPIARLFALQSIEACGVSQWAPYLDCHYCALATLPAGSGGTIRRCAEDTLGLLPCVNVNLHRAAAIRPRGGMQCAGDTAGWRRHKARRTISSLK